MRAEAGQTVALTVAPARYVLLPLASLVTGYSIKEYRRNVRSSAATGTRTRSGRRAPDGASSLIWLDIKSGSRRPLAAMTLAPANLPTHCSLKTVITSHIRTATSYVPDTWIEWRVMR